MSFSDFTQHEDLWSIHVAPTVFCTVESFNYSTNRASKPFCKTGNEWKEKGVNSKHPFFKEVDFGKQGVWGSVLTFINERSKAVNNIKWS